MTAPISFFDHQVFRRISQDFSPAGGKELQLALSKNLTTGVEKVLGRVVVV